MVLATQSWQGRSAQMRSHLDLQINLLAERKIAKLIQLVEELRVDLPMVRNRQDLVAEAMQCATDTRAMVDAIAHHEDATDGHAKAKSETRKGETR